MKVTKKTRLLAAEVVLTKIYPRNNPNLAGYLFPDYPGVIEGRNLPFEAESIPAKWTDDSGVVHEQNCPILEGQGSTSTMLIFGFTGDERGEVIGKTVAITIGGKTISAVVRIQE